MATGHEGTSALEQLPKVLSHIRPVSAITLGNLHNAAARMLRGAQVGTLLDPEPVIRNCVS
jgi:hypothetical protein